MIPLSVPLVGEEEIGAVAAVMRSGRLAQGPQVAAFEDEFAAYLGHEVQAVAVANGTMALTAALLAIGVDPGDEVILPAFTFIATANAVRSMGAIPVFADVDGETFNLTADEVERRLTERTRAVIAVHLFGHPADLDGIERAVEGSGARLVEDAAQAHGAAIAGRRVGTFGVGCFSFYPTKNMTTGEGGMVTTTDADVAGRLRMLRNHGMRERYEYEAFGLNLRMTEIAAAIGRVQLTRLEAWNEARRGNAAWLGANLTGVELPLTRPGVTHAFHQYTVRSRERDRLLARLQNAGVGAGVYYPTPLHWTAPYRGSGVSLPVSERLAGEVVSLPVRPGLTEDDLVAIAAAVKG